MNYERRFKRLVRDLLSLVEEHLKERDEAEQGTFDIDEMLDKAIAGADKPAEPVEYTKSSKKERASKRRP